MDREGAINAIEKQLFNIKRAVAKCCSENDCSITIVGEGLSARVEVKPKKTLTIDSLDLLLSKIEQPIERVTDRKNGIIVLKIKTETYKRILSEKMYNELSSEHVKDSIVKKESTLYNPDAQLIQLKHCIAHLNLRRFVVSINIGARDNSVASIYAQPEKGKELLTGLIKAGLENYIDSDASSQQTIKIKLKEFVNPFPFDASILRKRNRVNPIPEVTSAATSAFPETPEVIGIEAINERLEIAASRMGGLKRFMISFVPEYLLKKLAMKHGNHFKLKVKLSNGSLVTISREEFLKKMQTVCEKYE